MAYKPMDEIVKSIEDTVLIDKIIKPVYNFKASEWERNRQMSQREKSKLYYGTIHSADLDKIQKLFSVDDEDGKKIAAAY